MTQFATVALHRVTRRPPRMKMAHYPVSGIREILDLVLLRGGDVVRLELGEPGYPVPAHIADAGALAAHGEVRYTQSAGLLELRTEASDALARRYGTVIDPSRIVISQGGSQGIAAVFEALVRPGDEVVLPDPAWPNYLAMTTMRGATPVPYGLPRERGYLPDPAEIERLITPATRVLVINSPGNPTGAVMPRALVEQIVAIAARAGVVVVSDEVYDELIFDGEPTFAAAIAPDDVVSVFSFSKTYAMTGWRVGYLVLPPALAQTVGHIQESLISCVSTVSQRAALAALRGPQTDVAVMREGYRQARDYVVGRLRDGGIPIDAPAGAFYVMVPLAPGVDSRAAAIDLVDAGVAVAPGTAFGRVAADQVRLSLATSLPQLAVGIDRLLAWYHETGGGARLAGRSSG
ncbi:pyridoxal phosphate-dependent aminotransferase [Herbiconiux daphne]|uniref:Aminotransferase n=1 Tax=Herbiconiux daphne TaxID=2970914 RepID=A0ABT2GW76_9MICO|nr:aminotransferase class I/II-fold pyridoxal phosphate-dependent enzyme [Herbiconiux daphne]MCS5732218.1 aminotransferase class I/II-fold pyridoxal phosphate-dependent enzyme [Herbiconiux daphne]